MTRETRRPNAARSFESSEGRVQAPSVGDRVDDSRLSIRILPQNYTGVQLGFWNAIASSFCTSNRIIHEAIAN
jgi:hypothetical protein